MATSADGPGTRTRSRLGSATKTRRLTAPMEARTCGCSTQQRAMDSLRNLSHLLLATFSFNELPSRLAVLSDRKAGPPRLPACCSGHLPRGVWVDRSSCPDRCDFRLEYVGSS